MRKKYLKTIEDVEALRNTDTKIYCESYNGYFQFANGVLCSFKEDGSLASYNRAIYLEDDYYIEVEDEPSEDDIGKLGWFWDDDEDDKIIDRLEDIDAGKVYGVDASSYYYHFRPLTPEEVEKYTGYKVV
jgi:hypothetical protein